MDFTNCVHAPDNAVYVLLCKCMKTFLPLSLPAIGKKLSRLSFFLFLFFLNLFTQLLWPPPPVKVRKCLPMVWGTRVQSQVESYQRLKKKWYLIPPCLTLGIKSYVSRIKWSNSGKGVVPSPTPQCSSYWKGSLWVALDLKVVWIQFSFPWTSCLTKPKVSSLPLPKEYFYKVKQIPLSRI